MIGRFSLVWSMALLCAPLFFGAGDMRVPNAGVGGGIEKRQLIDARQRFVEGERVVFWTRVVDGAAGERVRHIWTHDGEERLNIGFTLGGAHWRTHSIKTMWPGSAGEWTVVAVDEADGRELARQTFVCAAAAEQP